MNEGQIYFGFTKANAALREVVGRATAEVPDRDNEMFDFDSSLPYMQAWSSSTFAASSGQSYGNLRYMHQPRVCGKLVDITFDADQKAVDVVAKITDEDVWNDIEQGVLCGFSLGGRYIAKWDDSFGGKPIKRFTASPSELSVVDRPSCPASQFFELRKRDGSTRHVAFKHRSNEEMSQHTPRPDDSEGRESFLKFVRSAHAGTPGDEGARHYGDLSKDYATTDLAKSIAAELRKRAASSGGKVSREFADRVAKDGPLRVNPALVEDTTIHLGADGLPSLADFGAVYKACVVGDTRLQAAFVKGVKMPSQDADDSDNDTDDDAVTAPLSRPSKAKKAKRAKAKKAKEVAEEVGKMLGLNDWQIAAVLAKMDDDQQSVVPSQRVTLATSPQSSYMSSPPQQYVAAPAESQPTDFQIAAFKVCLSQPKPW